MPTRTRTTGALASSTSLPNVAVVSGPNGWRNPATNQILSAGTYALSSGYGGLSDNRRSITDETGKMGQLNFCINSVREVPSVPSVSPCIVKVANSTAPFGSCEMTISGSLAAPIYRDNQKDSHLSTPDGSAVALARVPNTCPEAVQGLVALYELKDLKSALQAIPGHLLWAVARGKRAESAKAFNSWIASLKRSSRSPLAVLQALIGADLQWKFGIKPFLDDVQRTASALGRVNAQVDELRKKTFTVRGSHTEEVSTSVIHANGAISGSTASSYKYSIASSIQTKKSWTWGAVKRIDVSRLPTFNELRWHTIREQLGLRLQATDLWEVVPYSFVVDWFLPVQTFLEQFEVQPDPSWISTVGGWSTVRSETNGVVTEVIQPHAPGANSGVVSGGNRPPLPWRRVNYNRTVLTTLPSQLTQPTYIPTFRLPNFGQTWTGIELTIQRIQKQLK